MPLFSDPPGRLSLGTNLFKAFTSRNAVSSPSIIASAASAAAFKMSLEELDVPARSVQASRDDISASRGVETEDKRDDAAVLIDPSERP